jgi:hypothetical protein
MALAVHVRSDPAQGARLRGTAAQPSTNRGGRRPNRSNPRFFGAVRRKNRDDGVDIFTALHLADRQTPSAQPMRIEMTKATLAIAFALVAFAAAPASAAVREHATTREYAEPAARGPGLWHYNPAAQSDNLHTCGSAGYVYDSSGVPEGPYCN